MVAASIRARAVDDGGEALEDALAVVGGHQGGEWHVIAGPLFALEQRATGDGVDTSAKKELEAVLLLEPSLQWLHVEVDEFVPRRSDFGRWHPTPGSDSACMPSDEMLSSLAVESFKCPTTTAVLMSLPGEGDVKPSQGARHACLEVDWPSAHDQNSMTACLRSGCHGRSLAGICSHG